MPKPMPINVVIKMILTNTAPTKAKFPQAAYICTLKADMSTKRTAIRKLVCLKRLGICFLGDILANT